MSRRAILLLTTMLATLVVASGAALAVTKHCQTNVTCYGTIYADTLNGYGGGDKLYGEGGADKLNAGGGNDLLIGGSGNDQNNGGAGPDAYSYTANNWGIDTIKDTLTRDTATYNGDYLYFPTAITANLTINLSSSNSTHEVYSSGTQSTIDWSGSVIEDVNSIASGNTYVDGNDAANYIRSYNGVDNVYSNGGDDIIDVADGHPDDDAGCGDGDDHIYYDDSGTAADGIVEDTCEHLHPVP